MKHASDSVASAQRLRHIEGRHNHGSEPDPGPARHLGQFFAAAGYVLFAPHRHGHGKSTGNYPLDEIRQAALHRPGAEGRRRTVIEAVIALHERQLGDTETALGWLQGRAFVAAERVAMAGVSHGGIQTLLAAEADLGAAAYVAFAPGAMAWAENPELGERLRRAVLAARSPIFLLQAENDYGLGPSQILGPLLRAKGAPSHSRVYPTYGDSRQAGHGDFACQGTEVWGEDVCAFLSETTAASGPEAPPARNGDA